MWCYRRIWKISSTQHINKVDVLRKMRKGNAQNLSIVKRGCFGHKKREIGVIAAGFGRKIRESHGSRKTLYILAEIIEAKYLEQQWMK